MSPADAARILDLPADASPEQLESRFNELRQKLEEKIGKAPTPGLKAKYRESLDEITSAFETLTLAADSSSLPVTQKQSPGGGAISPAALDPSGLRSQVSLPGDGPDKHRDGSSQQQRGLPPAKRAKSDGKEFLLVAAIAVLVLAGGGWFVLKTRADNAEKARLAAEAKAEAERAAEAKQLAEQQQKDRLAAEAKAEQEKAAATTAAEKERRDKLSAQVRIALAEAKLQWEQIEKQEREAERNLSELRSEERAGREPSEDRRRELAARIAAHSAYVEWLSDFVATHPVKTTQVRATELLGSGLIAEAAQAADSLGQLITSARLEVADRKAKIEASLWGGVEIKVTGQNVSWVLTDRLNRTFRGRQSAQLDRVASGPAVLTASCPGWPETAQRLKVTASSTVVASVEFIPGYLVVTGDVAGAEVFLDGKQIGRLPLRLEGLAPREVTLLIKAAGHHDHTLSGRVESGKTLTLHAIQPALSAQESFDLFIRLAAGKWEDPSSKNPTYWVFEAGNPPRCRFVVAQSSFPKNLRLLSQDPLRVAWSKSGIDWFEIREGKLLVFMGGNLGGICTKVE